MTETVQEFIRNQRGVNNIVIMDATGNVLSNSYEACNGFNSYLDNPVKAYTIEDRANLGYVANLVI